MKNIKWRGHFTYTALRDHEQWARGKDRKASGRLELVGCNLRDAIVPYPYLMAARFVQCNLTGANMRIGNMQDLELEDCIWEEGLLEMATFHRAIINNCNFARTYFNTCTLNKVQVQGGDWSKTDMHNTSWHFANVDAVNFQQVRFESADLSNAHFVDCDMGRADLSFATLHNTTFERCDLREANLEQAELKNTCFKGCGFYGSSGTPEKEGSCQIVKPDLSEKFDGSRIVEAEEIFALWNLVELV